MGDKPPGICRKVLGSVGIAWLAHATRALLRQGGAEVPRQSPKNQSASNSAAPAMPAVNGSVSSSSGVKRAQNLFMACDRK